jgi:hypothetical protein
MRSTAPLPAIVLRTISGVLLTCALALMPAKTFAQRPAATGAAAAHAATSTPAVVRVPPAPVTRATQALTARFPGAMSRPTGITPFSSRSILIRPGATASGTQPRSPLLTSGVLLGSRPPRHLPIGPIVLFNPYLASGLFGFGFNGLFPCSFASGYGCGTAPAYYGYGFPAVPQGVYPTDPGYPPPDPNYGAVGPSATTSAALQYNVLAGDYSGLANLPESNLSAMRGAGGQLSADALLYFKDGSVFTIASYTVANGRLHYVTAYGGEGDIEVVELDVPKTIQANGARGVTFTLTPPRPAPATEAPGPPSPGPAEPGPIYPPKT